MSTALVQTTEIVENFVVDPNPLFNSIDAETVTKLQNLPNTVNYRTIQSTGDPNHLNFTENLNGATFLDIGAQLVMRIPVKFTLAADFTADITEANYMAALNNFENICHRQYGLIHAIQNTSMNLNNHIINGLEGTANAFGIVSQYYSDEELNERFDCSLPDKYYNYNLYNSTAKSYGTYDDYGNVIQFPKSVMEAQNPFHGSHDNRYNSRKVAFTYVGNVAGHGLNTKRDICGYVSLSTYIPFSLLGMPGDQQSLYGVSNFNLSATLTPDYVSRLFSVSEVTPGTKLIANITYAPHLSNFSASLNIREFASSQAITNRLRDATGKISPYRVGFTSVRQFNPVLRQLEAGIVTSIESSQIVLSTIPKSIYIGVKLKTPAGAKHYETPDTYARFQSLSIQNNVSQTIIAANNCRQIYELCKANGLNRDNESALRGCMFAVKLDAADIGWGSDSFIGEAKTFNIAVNASVLAPVAGQYELIVVTSHQNSLYFQDDNFSVVNGLIVDASEFKSENYIAGDGYTRRMTVVGGFGFGDVLNLGKKVGRYLANNHKDIREGLTSQWKKFQASGNNIVGGRGTQTLGAGSVNAITSFKTKAK